MIEMPSSAWTGPAFPPEAEDAGFTFPSDDRFIDWMLFVTRIVFGAWLAVMMVIRAPADFSLYLGLVCLAVVEIGNFVVVLPLILRRSPLSQIRGLLIDTMALMTTGAGIALMLENGYPVPGAEVLWNDFWPVYAVLIVVVAFHLSARRTLAYTLFMTTYFALVQLLAFPLWSDVIDRLPVRAFFLILLGGLLAGLASELHRRKARVDRGIRHLQEQSLDMLFLLATLVEARDDTTGEHLQRMQHYCRLIARELGLAEEMIETIAEASLIHDVGKAWTPEYILKKSGPLTADERRIMERHVIDGERLLGNRPAYRVHRQVARSHHERWDGAGYPDRLAGEEIPLAARIVAVADVYDALTSDRPYKRGWASRRAADEIRNEIDKHFDPAVARVFLGLIESGTFGPLEGEVHGYTSHSSGLLSA